jgi:hypothetical protein
MSRTPRIYTDGVNAGNFSTNGQLWTSSNAPDMTAGYTTISYNITIGSGRNSETYSQITIWQDGVISFGPATYAQKAFMAQFEGDANLSAFPGYYISAGYTDTSSQPASSGSYANGYGVEIATGEVDFSPLPDGSYQLSDATPVLRISWNTFSNSNQNAPGIVDKQVTLAPGFFFIGDTKYDSQGAGYHLGLVSVDGLNQVIPDQTTWTGDYFENPASDFGPIGRSDILWRNDAGDLVLWNAGATPLTFQSIWEGSPSTIWHIQAIGDYDGDGRADILWRDNSNDLILWTSQAGQSVSFQTQWLGTVGANWHIQQSAADFNGDGKADVLWRNDAGDVVLWNSAPGPAVTFTSQYIATPSSSWHVQGLADFNGDGDADVLWRNDNGDVFLWRSQPGSTVSFTGQDLGIVQTQWQVQAVGDINGDGRADVLWRDTTTGNVVVWMSNVVAGAVTFQSQFIGPVALSWQVQGFGDFNGDGRADVLWRNSNGDTYLWLSNPGASASFTGHDLAVVGSDLHIQTDWHFT